jgi:hypothetical protein
MKYKVTLTNKIPLPVGEKIELRKEPTNAYDNEAIGVWTRGVQGGYVSAFYKTRRLGTISGGRLYDHIKDNTPAVIVEGGVNAVAEVQDEVAEVLP